MTIDTDALLKLADETEKRWDHRALDCEGECAALMSMEEVRSRDIGPLAQAVRDLVAQLEEQVAQAATLRIEYYEAQLAEANRQIAELEQQPREGAVIAELRALWAKEREFHADIDVPLTEDDSGESYWKGWVHCVGTMQEMLTELVAQHAATDRKQRGECHCPAECCPLLGQYGEECACVSNGTDADCRCPARSPRRIAP